MKAEDSEMEKSILQMTAALLDTDIYMRMRGLVRMSMGFC